MTYTFYAINETTPSLTFSISAALDVIWDEICETLTDHILGEDPYFEGDARDLVQIVEMETADESEYVEAVFVRGKLVGSLVNPFWRDPSEYVRI